MVTTVMTYEGDLHCEARHQPSGAVLSTDAPTDNQGRGESFSPTDLVGAALGSCMLTVMGIAARAMGIAIEGATATVEKEMAAAPSRRIARLGVVITIPHAIAAADRTRLEAAALACPVHKSLHPDIAMPVRFLWGTDAA